MRRLIIIFFLVCAQELSAQPVLYFDRVTVQDGLSNNQVNCIYQDKKGFIWIGTNDGLNRYDGNNFLIFRHRQGDSTSLAGNLITDILEDENGLLWIATADGGLASYDQRQPAKLQFRRFRYNESDPNSIPSNELKRMILSKGGQLWIGSSGSGVFRMNRSTGKFEKPQQQGPRTIFDIEEDHRGLLWAGRQGGGILKINPVTLTSETGKGYEDLYAPLPHMVVTALHRDHHNMMWFGSWDKVLYRFDPFTQAESVFSAVNGNGFVNDEITSFAEDPQYLWMGGKENGLQLLDKSTGTFYHHAHDPAQDGTVSSNRINCIYIDKAGRTWIGTNRGVSISDPAQQQFSQTFLTKRKGIESLRVYDFFKDSNGDLWTGTSDGIYLQKAGTGKFIHFPLAYKGVPLAVTRFYQSPSGVFYIGTDYSLFVYDRLNNRISLLQDIGKDKVMSRIIESRITSIVESKINGQDALIVTPYGHFLSYYVPGERKWVSRLDSAKNIVESFGLKDYLVRKVSKFSDGSLWIANTREGLAEWRPGDGKPVKYYKYLKPGEKSLAVNNVYDIAEADSGKVYISTYESGLYVLDRKTGQFRHIPSTSNLTEGIAADREGNIWMVTNGNLQKYSPVTNSVSSYRLPDRRKSGGITGQISIDGEGYMYVAGADYFIRFHPDSVRTQKRQPQLYFTDFRIFNESYNTLLQHEKIRLGYRENYFTVEFSAPEFSRSGPVRYEYKLDGWDKEWIESGTRNFATYSNLEGGSYTFRVRASASPGTFSVNEQALRIVIIPPYWKRWWFYVLCAALVALIVFLLYRYRINELLKRQAIRNKIAQDLHDSVGSTLSSISVYSQVARIYKEKNQEAELQSTLEKISNTSGEMISEMNDIVWTINPRNDSMEKIFQRMESFAKPLLQTRGIVFSFRYDPGLLNIFLPMEKRKNFYLIFKEAINNVLKYSQCRNLAVKVDAVAQELHMTVQDDGVGFDAGKADMLASKSLAGNGLQNMRRRAEEMKGSLTVESAKGEGATITLRFPIT